MSAIASERRTRAAVFTAYGVQGTVFASLVTRVPTLQDRFGNRIAARDVQPKSYLPGSIPPSSFLSAGQRIDAEMGFADPGTDAVGFEIDACLPARGGGVACANDATLR